MGEDDCYRCSHSSTAGDIGANRGLGYATAKQLGSTGRYRLLIGARTQEKAEEAIKKLGNSSNNFAPVILDLNSDVSIKAAAAFIQERFGSLDILVNNGGINRSSDPNATLHTFFPLLRASKYSDRRIVNVTSGLGQIGIAYSSNSEYSVKVWELPAYRSSKTALNMINAANAVRLQKENILSIVVCPGYCQKDFGGRRGAKSAEEGAQPIVCAATKGSPEELSGMDVEDEGYFVEFGW
ncbi:NAD(P)-binding protein [Aspergillus eucalypticola CBS 122712]|uniref:NAD(P)-binding protein n=1 Tax=Aspergillus eucalypticola (strain CBS 122712 / IBT 29274) TaxID=1448314 RepID=A0A317UYU3_ASPEC|nr:NAD(P)-binding protein [Aspergillus eucalypticola CBS 122712]PWY66945.1 NAD(P)-binding protein [Aspergillus eucalypticola CBS 122712]